MPAPPRFSAFVAVLAAALSGVALAETSPSDHHAMGPDHQQMMRCGQHSMRFGHMPEMMRQHQGMMPMSGHAGMHAVSTTPTMPGQDAFGAVQEIVRMLEADPNTDWSKVDLEGLRQHFIDMNEVTLNAEAISKSVDGGLEVAVTGSNRTLAAIQRMIPAHANEIDGLNGWSAKTAPLPDGVLLTVRSTDPKEVQHVRGLGFIGLLVSGSHHQPHHLAMARGESAHTH